MENWEKVEYKKVKNIYNNNDSSFINNKISTKPSSVNDKIINKSAISSIDKKDNHNIDINNKISPNNKVLYSNSLKKSQVGSISIIKRPSSINNNNNNNNNNEIDLNINTSASLKHNNTNWANNMISKSNNHTNKQIKKIDPISLVNRKESEKKKPTIVTLFDIILESNDTSSIRNKVISNNYKSNSIDNISINNIDSSKAIEDNIDNINDKSVVIKRKKKKISSIRKKILRERFSRYLKILKNQINDNTLNNLVNNNNNLNIVCIENFCYQYDIEDKDEEEEIKSNINELLNSFGIINKIEFKTFVHVDICKIYVHFEEASSGYFAALSINGLTFGGLCIKSYLVNYDSIENCYIDNITINKNKTNKKIKILAILNLENLVFKEDVQDSDETLETLHDIRNLCQMKIDNNSDISIQNIWIEEYNDTNNNEINTFESQHSNDSNEPWLAIEFSSLISAIKIRDKLNGIKCSGTVLKSYLYDNQFYNKSLFNEDGIIDSNQLIGITMNNSINNSKRSCIFGIKIKDFIDSVYQLSDIDERNEIINDIHNLVKECYSSCEAIYFPRTSSLNSIDNVSSNNNNCVDCIIINSDLQACINLFNGLKGRTISGILISLEIVSLSNYTTNNNKKFEFYINGDQNEIISYKSYETIYKNINNNSFTSFSNDSSIDGLACVIIIKNYCTNIDMCGILATQDSDEMMKLKSDLLQLAEIDTTNNINMNRVTIISNLLSNFNDITKKKSTLTEKSLVAKIEYSNIQDAMNSMLFLDSYVVGGNMIKAYITYPLDSSIVNPNLIDTSIDSTITTNTMANTNTNNNIFKAYNNEDIIKKEVKNEETIIIAKLDSIPKSLDNIESNKVISIFKEAKIAPKQPKHEVNQVLSRLILQSNNINGVTGNISNSLKNVVKLSIPEIDELVKMMLLKLSSIAKETLEKNPELAKVNISFSCGINQCTKGIQNNKTKLLLLAPDTEESISLDEKLQKMIYDAYSKNIPVLYCLSRRRLAKAINNSMRQSCISVYITKDVEILFNQIVHFINIKDPIVIENK